LDVSDEKRTLKNTPRLISRFALAVGFGIVIWLILTLFSAQLMPLLQKGFEVRRTSTDRDGRWPL